MRPLWTGAISFGLVNIPVKIFSATKESTLDLDMLDERDHARIRFKRVNEHSGKEIPYEHIVRGYLYKGDYVVLDPEDFEAADAKKTKTIEILNFVDEKEIDSIYYEQPYYLEPDKSGAKAYALLREALSESGRVAVTQFVMRNKEALAILKPSKKAIILNRIRFEEEIRSADDLNLPQISKAKTKESKVAIQLIDQLTEKFNIASYKDTYTEKLLKIIHEKAKGKRPQKAVPKPKIVHTKSDDLMAILKASLGQKQTRKKAA
ncbi:MAG: Ku protein [Bacteroidota bacterium]|nr:Ku protein [Bacteroidota bacterium]MDP4231461.1 Ku protein [Bacteroidota bacterium]MDP4236765.1 Ku protein [Bacteroidota bacterium]